MKERPILFSGAMVRAILAGEKTQTRRVIKPQPTLSGPYSLNYARWRHIWLWDIESWGDTEAPPQSVIERCPYGQPGDRLWVRETWNVWGPPERKIVDYAATCPDASEFRWKSPLFMPRAASRITLEITGVRVERVQEISRADEVAEGVQPFREDAPDELPPGTKFRAFSALWDEFNTTIGYEWGDNPWVWVIEFKRLEPPNADR